MTPAGLVRILDHAPDGRHYPARWLTWGRVIRLGEAVTAVNESGCHLIVGAHYVADSLGPTHARVRAGDPGRQPPAEVVPDEPLTVIRPEE